MSFWRSIVGSAHWYFHSSPVARDSAGSRALMSMMRELGYQIGRFKVRNLMKEAGLASKPPGAHRYKVAQSERPDIPNLLAREFDLQQPNQVWCGDITYV